MRTIPARLSLFLLTLTLGLSSAGSSTAAEAEWKTSLAEAKAEAARTHRLVFVDLFAEWCGWCKVLERDVFSREAFQSFAADKVLVRLDVEDGAEGSRIQGKFEVWDLPTTLILDADEVLVGRIQGMAPEKVYMARIRGEILQYRQLEQSYDALTKLGEEAKPEALQTVAEGLHRRGDGTRSAGLYQRLEKRGWKNPRGAAMLPFRLADALRLTRSYEEAGAALERARRLAVTAGDEDVLEAIDLLGIQIATDDGDCQERRHALEAFLDQHPESSMTSRVTASLTALKAGADGSHCS